MRTHNQHLALSLLFLSTIRTSSGQGDVGECKISEAAQEEKGQPSVLTRKVAASTTPVLECGLYLAESSIPNAGWGMYTGRDLKENDVILPLDLAVLMADMDYHRKNAKKHLGLQIPKWLMDQYYWDCFMTHNCHEVDEAEVVVPGFGMLANSHPGMILADNMGPSRPKLMGGYYAPSYSVGASTPYHGQTFQALSDIPKGHEIFVEYGDEWFEERFGEDFGLSDHYETANQLLDKFQRTILDKHFKSHNSTAGREDMLSELWNDLFLHAATFDDRLHSVLSAVKFPSEKPFVEVENPAAYATVPNAIRPISWLQENGICMDHIRVDDSRVSPHEKGAFAQRDLPRGTIVAPAPVVHMTRDHLKMYIFDDHDGTLLWQGHQLLLNYVYGHKDSSLLLFPYAPAINIINHYKPMQTEDNAKSDDFVPNVRLQWSKSMPHPEWLQWSPTQVVNQTMKAGLVMEIVAIRDIKEGDEILLDYGAAWEEAFDSHVPPTLDLEAFDWGVKATKELKPQTDMDNATQPYPNFVKTLCYLKDEQHTTKGWESWKPTYPRRISEAIDCQIVDRDQKNLYKIIANNKKAQVSEVPRWAVTFVTKEYIGGQYLRDSFRHEIQLPDDMFPDEWKDLKKSSSDVKQDESSNEQCGLYLAESSIPGAGWGMYAGKTVKSGGDLYSGDIAIPVEDFETNEYLTGKYYQQIGQPYKPLRNSTQEWLLASYVWSSRTSGAQYEAKSVDSVIPGIGMLPNFKPGLVNTRLSRLERSVHNNITATTGATTTYHGCVPKVTTEVETGDEIFIHYGNDWLTAREDYLGLLPFEEDYNSADDLLEWWKKTSPRLTENLKQDLWDLIRKTIGPEGLNARVGSAFPKEMEEVEAVLAAAGTASYSTPDRRRSIQWLEEHGSCLDNIAVGPSDAGEKGAFATRSIVKGQIIAPMPMVHLLRSDMDVYSSKDSENSTQEVKWLRKQLLLNYCFGHPESNLMLFPYSPTVNYINHGDSPAKVNAKLQWSSLNPNTWFEKSVREVIAEPHSGLVMEVVSTRDISAQEEIFLDYGQLWETQWKNHTDTWKMPADWEYVSPDDVDDPLKWIRTTSEQLRNPYPNNMYTGCFAYDPEWNGQSPVNRTQGGDPIYKWSYRKSNYRNPRELYPCDVLQRFEPKMAHNRVKTVDPIPESYQVHVYMEEGKRFFFTGFPRRSITFVDKMYSSPLFVPGAFRHEIGLPDHLFPKVWRDLVE